MKILSNFLRRLGWAAPMGFAIAWANLAILGALIGWAGGSRAFGTGLHTLLRDHLPAVIASTVVAFALALLVARTVPRTSDLPRIFAFVVAADVVAAVLVVGAIGEITLLMLPRVLLTETVACSQLAAVALGLALGYAGRGGISRRGSLGVSTIKAPPGRQMTLPPSVDE